MTETETRAIDLSESVKRMRATVESILDKTGLEHAYDHLPADMPMLPYIVWSYTEEIFWADCVPYYAYYRIELHLYEEARSDTTEARLENALAGCYPQKIIDYDFDEGVYDIGYVFEI